MGETSSELKSLLRECRTPIVGIAMLSGFVNVLALTGSVYMLAVYDRVLVSGSLETLVSLSLIALAVYALSAFIDATRSHLLTRLGTTYSEVFAPRLFRIMLRRNSQAPTAEGVQPLRDLDSIRGFLASAGPSALMDMPWMPLYLAISFAFHWMIGTVVLAGILVLALLTYINERLSSPVGREVANLTAMRFGEAENARRNAATIRAMGMEPHLLQQFEQTEDAFLRKQRAYADLSSSLGMMSKTFRLVLQSAVLGTGAYLVVMQEATGGVMIASSILSARALAPVDQAIANWKSFQSARAGWERLDQLLRSEPSDAARLSLPVPSERLDVEGLVAAPPGVAKPVLRGLSFSLAAGTALGVVGPSGSGKTTLVRALLGLWPILDGRAALDGVPVGQWASERLGPHVGYLPQGVSLVDGTIAANIGRFDPAAPAERIVAAAREAGVHELIAGLPVGYDTVVGEGGVTLSAGQSQRIALARALYGDPFLVVLDEPNSNLDVEGEQALAAAITAIRRRGGIAIVVAHRPSVLASVDLVLVVQDGVAFDFGPRDEVLRRVIRPAPPPTAPTPTLVGRPARSDVARAG